ncbi:MAG TPA: serine hydrolase domain-containing protein [Kofleriaceae bacterium]|nr:serine hydrolase domain-containing protein [Kofleriaceae bacterium]
MTRSPEPAKPSPEAQTEAQTEKPIEAQAMFTRWLDAFNESNKAGLEAFAKHLAPELAKNFPNASGQLGFRENTGGFDVKKTEDATPTKYVAIVKERGDDQYARVVFELDASSHVRVFDIRIVPAPAEYKPARLSEADAIAALRAELDALVAKDKFSGTVLVAKNGKPIFAQAYGMADREKQIANTLDTRFRIGSMNKMFTATATLQLVQAKKLSLDDTVGKHLPDYPNKNVASKVKIHHLLTHTGGTGDIFGPDFDAKRLELRTLEDYVKLYGTRELLHEPGEGNRYSNYGFLLLGVIIEKVAKKSYYDHLQASVFKPAKMTSTSSPFEDKPMAGRSIAYTKELGDKRLAEWTDAKDTLPIRATSAGGGDSTVGDLLKFANALTANQLLDKKHSELLTARKTGEPAGGYAYGFGTSEEDGIRCFGHGGGANGMNGDLQICDSGYTIAVLANLDPPTASRVLRFIKVRLPKP